MGCDTRLTRDGAAPKTGIVHFGPGAFFRAFNAVYTQDTLDADGGDWGIAAVSLKSPTARDQLGPQGGVYTAVTRGPDGETHRVIASIAEILVATEDRARVLQLMTDPAVRIVSLTITEKGYGFDPATGGLDRLHDDIAADLKTPRVPRSAVGLVTLALEHRRAAGMAPFTVLSCDNLPSNGKVTRRVVLDYATLAFPDLRDWVAEHTAFPSTMVDRITPATVADDLHHLTKVTGYVDKAAVFHEPFRQWVIEDDFPTGRPAWEAQFVDDVAAHELMKLRCLNGTHSSLAYLGYLAGFETISDTVSDPDFAQLCDRLWSDEILPTVPKPQGEDLQAYCAALMGRYRNPNIRHRTWQIAMDGSQKLPQRVLGTVADNLHAGRACPGLMHVIAAWMRYTGGRDETGGAIDVRDPMADRLRAAWNTSDDVAVKVARFLAIEEVFPKALADNHGFRTGVTAACENLVQHGSRRAVAALVGA